MATTTELEPHRGWAGKMAFFGKAQPNERSKRVMLARRHTRLVHLLRWTLPAVAGSVLILYAAMVLQTIGWVDELPQIAIPKIVPENLTMDNPRYEGFNDDGGSYVVTAKTAVQDLTDLSLIKLNGIVGDLIDANKVKTKLKAARGNYYSKQDKLDLYDGIDIVSENGMHARLARATVLTKRNIVYSKVPVTVELPAGTIHSKQMTLHNKTREVTFLDSVEAHLVPGTKTEAQTAPAAGSPLISAANGPIDITASRLDINDKERTATFSGNVRAVQGDAVLTTAALSVAYENQQTDAGASATAAGNKIRRIASQSPVVMTRAPQDRVTAESLDFDAAKDTAVLTGNVVMSSGSDRQVSGNVATIDQTANTVLLTGNVVAIQGRNQLTGERLLVERATGRTYLSSPAALHAKERGRISTRFYRGETAGGQAQSPQSALASGAAAVIFKTDPNAPIDVEADRLDVDDRGKAAVFKGDVRARQADFLLRTSRLNAYYTGQAGLAEQTAAAGKRPPAQLSRIEARGKVIVTSKDGQNATGDWANFNVKTNKVTVGGDVVLTQGKNVVRGTRLVIDMVTGQSVIQNDPTSAWSATAAPKVNSSDTGFVVRGPTSRGRPSAIFYPRRRQEDSKSGGTPTTQKPSASDTGNGWETTTPAP